MSHLVLTRKAGESITIGDTICVTVRRFIGRSKVSLSIIAPDDIRVLRAEVRDTSKPGKPKNGDGEIKILL